MMRAAAAVHTSHIKTLGPATNFDTWVSSLPQKEQWRSFLPNMSGASSDVDASLNVRRKGLVDKWLEEYRGLTPIGSGSVPELAYGQVGLFERTVGGDFMRR